ncbi:hypothetical protein, partial [Thermomonas sp.]|uniref:hypothetical protein n=1 Tax=Thermomonas sp. TaxID=1971895 RepID=UPI002612E505
FVSATICLIVLLLCGLCYPPFPRPNQMVGKTHGILVNELGPPAEIMPGKYALWARDRLIGKWIFMAGYDYGIDKNSRPISLDRHLLLGSKRWSIVIFRSSTSPPPVR